MHQLTRIIVGHDLRSGGDNALESALVLASRGTTWIRLVHVVAPHHFHRAMLGQASQRTVEEIVTRSGMKLEERVRHQSTDRIDYEVRVGKPLVELILASRAWQADLIIIGNTAQPPTHLLGGTAEQLIRRAFVPVLVIRKPLKCKAERFLLPTDFSEGARKAAKEGIALAESFRGRIFFFHAFDPSPWYNYPYGDETIDSTMMPELTPEDIECDWESFIGGLSLKSVPSQTSAEYGPAADMIVRYADTIRADIIVMGTHGRTGLEHMLLGSVAEAVVRTAPCPVLTIKPEAFQFTLP
jgi:nucleotide-binding universal stress UspA family protein